MTKIKLKNVPELAGDLPVSLDKVLKPTYGRGLEDFVEGQVYVHPRGLTLTKGLGLSFATTFMEANPLYLNREYAVGCGFKDILISPLLTLNVALSLGVQNDSEKAIANLGYYNVKFCEAVYPGDSLRSYTKVIHKRERGAGEPGIITLRTQAVNQNGTIVLQYDRKIMVAPSGKKSVATTRVVDEFNDVGIEPNLSLPAVHAYPKDLTGIKTYFENFNEGDIIVHANGRMITDEHIPWTYGLMNTHPLHVDRLYTQGLTGKLQGEPVVYGGLIFAWLCGLASRDVSENAIWDLGYTEGYHTQPAVSGDTLCALSRVLKKEEGTDKLGIVQFQLIGLKNLRPEAALKKYKETLFVKEGAKKAKGMEKIPEKIFEIERRLLIKKNVK